MLRIVTNNITPLLKYLRVFLNVLTPPMSDLRLVDGNPVLSQSKSSYNERLFVVNLIIFFSL